MSPSFRTLHASCGVGPGCSFRASSPDRSEPLNLLAAFLLPASKIPTLQPPSVVQGPVHHPTMRAAPWHTPEVQELLLSKEEGTQQSRARLLTRHTCQGIWARTKVGLCISHMLDTKMQWGLCFQCLPWLRPA